MKVFCFVTSVYCSPQGKRQPVVIMIVTQVNNDNNNITQSIDHCCHYNNDKLHTIFKLINNSFL